MQDQRTDVSSIHSSDIGGQRGGEGEMVYGVIAEMVGGMRVLHVKSGWGEGSDVLAVKARSVTGIEEEAERVGYAREKWRRPNLEFIAGDVISRSELSGAYEAVVALGLTVQMPRVRQMLARICEAMEDEGVAWVSVEGSEEGGTGTGTFSWQQYLKGFFLEVEAGAVGRCGEGGEAVYECRRPRRTKAGLTSIVIPVKGLWNYTESCLDSIGKNTPERHEVIVVDNGSEDETAVELARRSGVRVVTNGVNLGFGVASNQGIRESRGEYVLILNNDTLVTPGWLGRMLRHVTKPGVGTVGPMSNYVSQLQSIPEPGYEDSAGLDRFAIRLGHEYAGASHEVVNVSGLCMLVRRKVIQAIGGFDHRFGLGNFEDTDIGLRTRLAGYQILVARDAFIHHFGSKTILGDDLDWAELMRENWGVLKDKWEVSLARDASDWTEQWPGFLDSLSTRTFDWRFCYEGSVWDRPKEELGGD